MRIVPSIKVGYRALILLDDECNRAGRLKKLVGVLSKTIRGKVGLAAVAEQLREVTKSALPRVHEDTYYRCENSCLLCSANETGERLEWRGRIGTIFGLT